MCYELFVIVAETKMERPGVEPKRFDRRLNELNIASSRRFT